MATRRFLVPLFLVRVQVPQHIKDPRISAGLLLFPTLWCGGADPRLHSANPDFEAEPGGGATRLGDRNPAHEDQVRRARGTALGRASDTGNGSDA